MTANEFIFSDKLKCKLARHSVFWMIYYIHTVLPNIDTLKIETLTNIGLYKSSLVEALIYLPVYALSVYFIIYFVLPKYLAKKNIAFLLSSLLLLAFITAIACYFLSATLLNIYGIKYNSDDLKSIAIRKFVGEQIMISGLATIIKIMKDYTLKQRENEKLSLENINNKLQLLKIKMQPSILFSCLQSIHADIENGTTNAPQMILKLSDLLSYMLYQTDATQVTLIKEIEVIKNYLDLKKLEYKNKLEIDFNISGNVDYYYITPGLFLTLLEISFISFNNVEILFLNINFRINESMSFVLKNNLNGNQIIKTSFCQTTLENISAKLKISNTHDFELNTHCTKNTFVIALEIKLKKISIGA